MPPERDIVRLTDMLNAAKDARVFFGEMAWDDFLENAIIQSACIYKIIIIGEAARQISQEFKAAHPEMNWQLINGMRNKIIHEYGSVNLLIVWDVLQNRLPELIEHLTTLLPDEPQDE